jgi:hypothetical protein
MKEEPSTKKLGGGFDTFTEKHGTAIAFVLVLALFMGVFYFYRPYAMEVGQQVEDTSLESAKKHILVINSKAVHTNTLWEKPSFTGPMTYNRWEYKLDGMRLQPTRFTPYTGWARETWEGQGAPKWLAHFTDGVLDGPYFAWHGNGVQEGEGIWDMGKRMYARAWHDDGTPTKTKVDNGVGLIVMYNRGKIPHTKIRYEGGEPKRVDNAPF